MRNLSKSSTSSSPDGEGVAKGTRLGELFTPLEGDELVLLELSGTEGINQIGEYRIRALGGKTMVDFDDLIGHPMRILLHATGSDGRVINMIAVSARFLGTEADGRHLYEFELRPWIWLMDHRVNARIFHNETPRNIISKILTQYTAIKGVSFDFVLNSEPEEMEYCVQYGESDLAFVRRLLEEFGLNFFMQMKDTTQALVITDSMDGFVTIPGEASRPFFATDSRRGRRSEHFSQWLPQRNFTSGAVKLMDYNFVTPRAEMEVTKAAPKPYQMSGLESYVFPGRYGAKSKGEGLAQRRLDALRSGDHGVRAQGEVVSLGAGMKVTATGLPQGEDAEYICLVSNIHLREGEFGGSGGKPSFHGHYDLALTSAPLAPKQVTKKPVIQGPQTALVIAAKDNDDEIDCDKYGRILVQFPWAVGSSSMRCRVQQAWAGKGWGAMQIPRVGMEVLVEFLNGDPDAPIVVGSIYNADNMPPFGLPDGKAISGIKSKTYKGDGYNQLSFDDSNGKQVLHMHAERDLDLKVKNDAKLIIEANRTEKITGKLDLTVKGNRTEKIETDDTLSVKQKLSITAGSKIELKVGTSKIEITESSIKLSANSIEIDAKMDLKTKGGMTAEHSAGTDMTIKSMLVKIN